MEHGKYIVLNENHLIAFDATMSHVDVANVFGIDQVTSAGFISTAVDANNDIAISCYGESLTLKISSDSVNDTHLARYALGIAY